MLLQVSGVLTAEEVQTVRAHLGAATWSDGRLTAGYRSAQVKVNLQVPQGDPAAQEASGLIVRGPGAQRHVHQRDAAASCLPAAVQSLPGRYGLWRSRR